MLRQELINELKARGYNHAITYGGPVPIDNWDPYGLDGVNKFGDMKYHGEIIAGDKVRDVPDPKLKHLVNDGTFLLGVWSFSKL